jgi:hypothetical protein
MVNGSCNQSVGRALCHRLPRLSGLAADTSKNIVENTKQGSFEFRLCLFSRLFALLLLYIAGVNHNTRLLTLALILGIGVVAVLLDLGGLLKRRLVSAFIALLLVIQTGIIAWPISRETEDGWDWGQRRELAHGLSSPSIVHLILGSAFNPPQIQYAWICHGETVSEEWLWRYEEGPINWSKVNGQLERADIGGLSG